MISKDRISWLEMLLWRVIDAALRKLESLQPPPQVEFHFSIGPVTPKAQLGTNNTMNLNIDNTQKIKLQLQPRTRPTTEHPDGIPVTIDGPARWERTSGESTLGTISDDGLTAELVSSDNPGPSQFTVKGDADLGEGVTEISETIDLTVTQAGAATLGVSAAVPEQK